MLGFKDHTFTRYAAGTNTSGDFVPGASSQVTVKGSLQPLSAREQQRLKDGAHARARWTFFTKDALLVDEGLQKADELHRGDVRLKVIGVEDYSDVLPGSGLAHREYYLAEKEHAD